MGRGRSKGGKGGGNSEGTFVSFPDKAISGWEYSGDGADQEAFFLANSNNDDLINQMTYEETGVFKEWGSGHFMGGQQYLGWDNMSDDDKERTAVMDKYMDQFVLNEGVKLARLSDAQLVLGAGHKKATLAELQAMEGKTVTSKGAMSFGAAAEGLTIGDSRKNVEYKLSIPGGSKGSGMWVGDRRINYWGSKQREFATNRDIAIKVGKTTYNKNRNVYEVELTFVGRTKHDYGKAGKP